MGTLKRTMLLLASIALVLTTLMAAPSTADAQDTATANDGSDQIFGTVATCIESDTVQSDPAAASMGVGNVYEGNDGTRHLITTGGPSCSFNCEMGFDANCDGIRGDYCPPHLDVTRVSHVGLCLGLLAASDAAAAADPAPAAAASDVEGGLAYTGAESTALAIMGAGFVSAGAFAMGVRRRVRR